jgi:hypothetical protein
VEQAGQYPSRSKEGLAYAVCRAQPPEIAIGNVTPFEVVK